MKRFAFLRFALAAALVLGLNGFTDGEADVIAGGQASDGR